MVTDPSLLWRNYGSQIVGLFAGVIIGLTTDYYTDTDKKPVQEIAKAAQTGHAMVILSGFAYGLESVAAPTIGIIIAMASSYAFGGYYGIASASVGMLSVIGTIVSNDAYGPIVDNAKGIAEQGKLPEEAINLCDKLDAAGNTAKAVTKGFAIGAAVLTVLGLLFSFVEEANTAGGIMYGGTWVDLNLDLEAPNVIIGAIIGSMMPAIFSAVLIRAVQVNAEEMVKEIHRQFREDPGILKGTSKADYAKCVDIATLGALKKLIVPIVLSIVGPLATGLVFGLNALAAYLVGTILSGLLLSLLMSNAGGAWDNAKKYIEDGNYGGKGSEAHKAGITGDTVGDPFKDTAGPSINTLQAVQCLTSSMFIPVFILVNTGAGLFKLS